jgi:DNA-binding transcriptional regulator LsrR (DeoR family)
MQKNLNTDQVIEALIAATAGEEVTARQRHIYRENLRSLVRLAKAEQIVEIKTNVKKLAGALEAHHARRRAKAILLAQRLPGILSSAQQQFEFNQ